LWLAVVRAAEIEGAVAVLEVSLPVLQPLRWELLTPLRLVLVVFTQALMPKELTEVIPSLDP